MPERVKVLYIAQITKYQCYPMSIVDKLVCETFSDLHSCTSWDRQPIMLTEQCPMCILCTEKKPNCDE